MVLCTQFHGYFVTEKLMFNDVNRSCSRWNVKHFKCCFCYFSFFNFSNVSFIAFSNNDLLNLFINSIQLDQFEFNCLLLFLFRFKTPNAKHHKNINWCHVVIYISLIVSIEIFSCVWRLQTPTFSFMQWSVCSPFPLENWCASYTFYPMKSKIESDLLEMRLWNEEQRNELLRRK